MGEKVVVPLLFAAVGALSVALGVPLLRGRVPPNRLYGCRTRATLAGGKLWYEVNRVQGRDMIQSGVAVIILSLVVLAFGRSLNAGASALVLIALTLAGVARMAWHCARAKRRL